MKYAVIIAVAIAGCVAAAAALAAFACLCAVGAARDALGILGCFTPCIAWLAYDFGRAAR